MRECDERNVGFLSVFIFLQTPRKGGVGWVYFLFFLCDRSCLLSRPLMFSFTSVRKLKKVYTFLKFRVHLFGIRCTPFRNKVYTFLYCRALD